MFSKQQRVSRNHMPLRVSFTLIISVPKPAHLFFLCPYNKHLAIHASIFHVLLDVKLPKVRKPSVLLVLDKVERGMGMGLFSI